MKEYKYRKTFTFKGKRYVVRADTKLELGKKLERKLAELKADEQKESNILVKDWTERCIELYKTNQSEITRKKYLQRINHCILERIGDMRVKDVTPMHCQMVMNYQNGKSRTQVNEVYQALKFIFSHAVFNEVISKDPTLTLIKPKATQNHRRALNDLERSVFLKVAPTDRKFYSFLLMYYCGCRPLEATNCKGSDLFVVDGQPMLHIRGTKTKNADRNVPIPPELWQLIKNTPKNEYIALHRGLYIDPDTRTRVWYTLWRAMNEEAGVKRFRNAIVPPFPIPKELTPYCLRHDFCTNLARRGIDIRIAQRLMGHSDIKLTANVYTHIDDTAIIDALDYKM